MKPDTMVGVTNKTPPPDNIWRETQMKTLQAGQVDLSRLRRSLGRFATSMPARFARTSGIYKRGRLVASLALLLNGA